MKVKSLSRVLPGSSVHGIFQARVLEWGAIAFSSTSWQIDGETIETVTDFIFLGSKITVDSDCSHEIKRWLLLGVKSMTNLDSVLKSRDVTLPTKVHLVKVMVFPWWTSLVAQTVKHPPTMQETQVQSLGWEDLLEKEMATHSSVLAARIPGTGEPGGLPSMVSQSDTTEVT